MEAKHVALILVLALVAAGASIPVYRELAPQVITVTKTETLTETRTITKTVTVTTTTTVTAVMEGTVDPRLVELAVKILDAAKKLEEWARELSDERLLEDAKRLEELALSALSKAGETVTIVTGKAESEVREAIASLESKANQLIVEVQELSKAIESIKSRLNETASIDLEELVNKLSDVKEKLEELASSLNVTSSS